MVSKMRGIHTHYDNLRVGRDAHPKIIREAYKKLSRQYHPDHNPNNPEATRAMQVINLAYDVLSDPIRRKEHDEWIARMEEEKQESPIPSYEEILKHPEQQKFSFGSSVDRKAIGEHIFKHWFWYVLTIATIIGFGYHSYSRSQYNAFVTSHEQYPLYPKSTNGMPSQPSGSAVTSGATGKASTSIPNEMQYVRPSSAPDGQSWPSTASYLSGYEQANLNGLSSVAIENDRNGSDVIVKLFAIESGTAVRVFYIPARQSFKLANLPPGLYDIRFLDLESGQLFRTEPFELLESAFANGSRHTVISMKLKPSENSQSFLHSLKQEDF